MEQQAFDGDIDAQYKLGLYYCTQNNINSAIRWLSIAAYHQHQDALMVLTELLERDLVPSHLISNITKLCPGSLTSKNFLMHPMIDR